MTHIPLIFNNDVTYSPTIQKNHNHESIATLTFLAYEWGEYIAYLYHHSDRKVNTSFIAYE